MRDELFRLLCQRLPYPLSVHSRDGSILWANQAFADLVGKALEEVKGEKCYRLLHNLEAFPSFCPLMEVIHFNHHTTVRTEEIMPGRTAEVTVTPLEFDKEGKVKTCLHLVREITEEIEQLNRLRQTERAFTAILDASVSGIAFLVDHCFQWVNRGFTEILGYEMAEVQNMPLSSLFDSELEINIRRKEAHQALRLEGRYRFQSTLRHKNGNKVHCLVGLSPLERTNLRQGLVLTIIDISDLTKAQANLIEAHQRLEYAYAKIREINQELEVKNRELELARQEAEEANRLKSEFLASTSHELRTPINSIMGFLKLVLDGLYDNEGEMLDFVRTAYESAGHLLNLINDVLDVAKIEAGRLEIDCLPLNLSDFFTEIRQQALIQARSKNISLVVDDPGNLYVYADQQRLRQILVNLIGNAIKFTDRGEVRLWAEIKPGTDLVVINVQDTGIGIPPDKLRIIFEAFRQVDSSPSRPYGGTGLGLTISKKLAELMGGRLSVTSPGLGRGTMARVYLPAAGDLDTRTAPMAPEAKKPVDVFVVFRNRVGYPEIKEVLEQKELSYHLFCHPDEVAAMIEIDRRPRLIISDLIFPCREEAKIRTGEELLNFIDKTAPSVGMILYDDTDELKTEELLEVYTNCPFEILPKPPQRPSLLKALFSLGILQELEELEQNGCF
ncbi:PAS domain-containing sensor histidine kinase [Thermosulfuriphilus sp.]